MATKAAAQRAGKTTVAARGSNVKKTSKSGFGIDSPLGVNARLGTSQTPGNTNVPTGAPAYETPAGMGAVTPIAAPPVVTDPFLTPTDLANQALEMSDVTRYLTDVDLNVGNARVDAQQKTAAIDTAEGRNLEAADWNTAARGLGSSSIRDTTKANLSSDAAQARGTTAANLKLANDYAASEHNRIDTVVNPAIKTKYDEFAKKNAQDVTDNTPAPNEDPSDPGTPGPTPTNAPAPTRAPASDPGSPTKVEEQWQPVVKNGNFYHYYPSENRYVFIRKAS